MFVCARCAYVCTQCLFNCQCQSGNRQTKKITIHAYEYKHFRRGEKSKSAVVKLHFQRVQFISDLFTFVNLQIIRLFWKQCKYQQLTNIKCVTDLIWWKSNSRFGQYPPCVQFMSSETHTRLNIRTHTSTQTHVLRSKYTANRISAIMLNVHLTAHMPPKI